jgi:hypothetical protein
MRRARARIDPRKAGAVAGRGLSEGLGFTWDVSDEVRDPNVDTGLEEKRAGLTAMVRLVIEEVMKQ